MTNIIVSAIVATSFIILIRNFIKKEIPKIPSLLYCRICYEPCNIPVRCKFSCCLETDILKACNYVCCLRCIREYFELNKFKSHRSNTAKCLVGEGRLFKNRLNANTSYQIDIGLMCILNEYINIIECSCGKIVKTQHDLLRHYRMECSKSTISCKYFSSCHYVGLRATMHEHEYERHINN